LTHGPNILPARYKFEYGKTAISYELHKIARRRLKVGGPPHDQAAQSLVGHHFIPVIEHGVQQRLAPNSADNGAEDGGTSTIARQGSCGSRCRRNLRKPPEQSFARESERSPGSISILVAKLEATARFETLMDAPCADPEVRSQALITAICCNGSFAALRKIVAAELPDMRSRYSRCTGCTVCSYQRDAGRHSPTNIHLRIRLIVAGYTLAVPVLDAVRPSEEWRRGVPESCSHIVMFKSLSPSLPAGYACTRRRPQCACEETRL
jgi:hypothetical protein